MTHKIIKVDNYLLVVDDSEIKVGDYFYSIREIVEQAVIDYPKNEHHGVILAHLPLNESSILNGVPLLPPIEDDVEMLANEYIKGYEQHPPLYIKMGFIKGYKKAREKYKYTEEDMKLMFEYGYRKNDLKKWEAEDCLLFFHQYPTEFESEMVGVIEHKDGLVTNQYEIPKTITTAQGIQWVGKYK